MKMLALEAWGINKPPFLAMIGQYIAVSADLCFEICRRARCQDDYGGRLRRLSRQDWSDLLRRRRGLMASLEALYAEEGDAGFGIAELYGCRSEAAQMLEKRGTLYENLRGLSALEFVEDINEGCRLMRAAYEEHLVDLKAMVSGGIPELSKVAGLLDNREVLFFVKVVFPCWLEYGMPFLRLVRKARQGDLDALEKLLRLDEMALEDGRVRGHYYEAVGAGNTALAKRFHRALQGEPCRRFSKQKLKVSLAVLVYKAFREAYSKSHSVREGFKKAGIRFKEKPYKITLTEVRHLFDAAAQDLRGELRDLDLPEDDHALRMAVKRESSFWQIRF
jgi:hypothetical protein